MATKEKFSFNLNGIQYADIPGYRDNNNTIIRIGVTGTAVMIRQYLYQKYGITGRDAVAVRSDSFAGGDSINVYLNKAPDALYKQINRDLDTIFEEGSFDAMTDSYTYTKGSEKTSAGETVDYGTKYLNVVNEMPYGSNQPVPDWSKFSPRSSKPATAGRSGSGRGGYGGRGSGRSGFTDNGTLLQTCGGWSIYERTLPDGSKIVNAIKDKGTPSDKSRWDEIRGAVLTEATFTWNKKYQLFENKSLAYHPDAVKAEIIERLCEVLRKYYVDDTVGQVRQVPPAPPTSSQPAQPVTPPAPTSPSTPTGTTSSATYPIVRQGIPPNPKLEYCRIEYAEGVSEYVNLFPRDFSSFTELTAFIADNIIDLPSVGYDKHSITWKWKYSNLENADRWDISENDSNPRTFDNLYAFESIRSLCWYIWADHSLSYNPDKEDDFYADVIGKDGLEIDNDEFIRLLDYCIAYYPSNANFIITKPNERLIAFKNNYPKLYKLFNTPSTAQPAISYTKDELQEMIRILRVAAKANPTAQPLIDLYELLLKNI